MKYTQQNSSSVSIAVSDSITTADFIITTKNTHLYLLMKEIAVLMFIVLFITVMGLIVLPNKAAASTDTTLYIPVSGLGYYVDSQGRPITSATTLQYSCVNNVCTQSGNTPSGSVLIGGTSTINALVSNAPDTKSFTGPASAVNGSNVPNYNLLPYPSYATPVRSTQNVPTSIPNLPVPFYSTPLQTASTYGVGSNEYVYLPYPTYGPTPLYDKIAIRTNANNATSAFVRPNNNLMFQNTSNDNSFYVNDGNNRNGQNTGNNSNYGNNNGGRFIMTNSSF